jgi:hypothetical protein
MKSLTSILLIAAVASAAWWGIQNNPNMQTVVEQYIDNGDIVTFEARYTPEKLMELQSRELLGDGGERTFQRADMKFHPYVMLDVKYNSSDKRTREGILLWSLVDGEMITDCTSWEQTHGFEDAINAQANRNDFKILNALARNKGRLSIDQLQKELQLEEELLHSWIEEAKDKHLIVQKGGELQLHFQNPKILVSPQTKISQCMVTKPYSHTQKIARKYSVNQVEKIAHAAFGTDFAIRSKKEIFLPVYNIEVLNPDGSILTTQWNALNGKKIVPRYLQGD